MPVLSLLQYGHVATKSREGTCKALSSEMTSIGNDALSRTLHLLEAKSDKKLGWVAIAPLKAGQHDLH